MTLVEEMEIKIEYFELFDTDPLSENAGKGHKKHFENHEVIVPNTRDGSNTTTLETRTSVGNKSEITPVETPTWYKSIDNVGRYRCKFCELSYHTVCTLRRHITTKHPDGAKTLKGTILNNKRNKKMKCHVCKKRFKTLNELQNHVNEAHDIKNSNSCPICKAKFLNCDEKSDHMSLIHNIVNKTLYCCNFCGYQTAKKSHFKQHSNTHTENNKKMCPLCDYSTNYPPNMRIHERIHTKEMAYVCHYQGCAYKCVAKSALRSHQLKHNREKHMLYCDQCAYKTVYKQSLQKHVDSHSRSTVRLRSAVQ